MRDGAALACRLARDFADTNWQGSNYGDACNNP